MSISSKDGGRWATVRTTVTKTVGEKNKEDTKTELYTMDYELADLEYLEDATLPTARVRESVLTTVQDSERYGKATWDMIPYRVEVRSEVTLECGQSPDKIRMAQEIAHELAFNSVLWTSKKSLAAHRHNIRTELFAEYFPDD